MNLERRPMCARSEPVQLPARNTVLVAQGYRHKLHGRRHSLYTKAPSARDGCLNFTLFEVVTRVKTLRSCRRWLELLPYLSSYSSKESLSIARGLEFMTFVLELTQGL